MGAHTGPFGGKNLVFLVKTDQQNICLQLVRHSEPNAGNRSSRRCIVLSWLSSLGTKEQTRLLVQPSNLYFLSFLFHLLFLLRHDSSLIPLVERRGLRRTVV